MTREDLDSALRQAVILGTLAVLLGPAARGSSDWLGWLPLWLVGLRPDWRITYSWRSRTSGISHGRRL